MAGLLGKKSSNSMLMELGKGVVLVLIQIIWVYLNKD